MATALQPLNADGIHRSSMGEYDKYSSRNKKEAVARACFSLFWIYIFKYAEYVFIDIYKYN